MKKIIAFCLIAFTLISCVSSTVFNKLESRYAQLKDNYNRQFNTIETLKEKLKELDEKYKVKEETLSLTQDSLRANNQNLDKLQTSLELLKLNSESALKARIADNEKLMEKIADRENELVDKITKVNELEGLIARQKQAMADLKEKLSDALLNFEDKGLTVEARNGKVYVSMENKLLFKSGSWTLELEGQRAISRLGDVLAENPDISILIEGHTDNIPYSCLLYTSPSPRDS